MAIEKFTPRQVNPEKLRVSGSVNNLEQSASVIETDPNALSSLFQAEGREQEMLVGAVDLLFTYTGVDPKEIEGLDPEERRQIAKITSDFLEATKKADTAARRALQKSFQAVFEEAAYH